MRQTTSPLPLRPAWIPTLALGVSLIAVTGCTRVGGANDEFRPAGAPPPVVAPYEVARRHIGARDISRHIAFLAADARRGRGVPGPGLRRAAAWIADELHKSGLEAAGDHGGFLQYWPYAGEDGGSDEDDVDQPANVVGRLPGADLTRAAEYVVVVAHYDHLGVGEPDQAGDSIYNGADDNASGVAALIEVARAFTALPERTPRPLLFLAVSGHEQGLAGSNWFLEHPTVDLSDAVAVLNLDMIGRNHPDSIGVVGYGRSGLGPLIHDIASTTPHLGLTVVRDPDPDAELFRRSDHFPFARRGIPAVQFFAGFHDDHGTPADKPRTVDDEKIARVARLAFLTAHRLAHGDVEPGWTERRAVHRP